MSLRASEVFAPRRRRGKPERAVQKAVLVWLRTHGALVAVTDAGAAYRAGAFFGDAIPAGWPDITGLLPDGRFISVECKAPGGRQSAVQKRDGAGDPRAQRRLRPGANCGGRGESNTTCRSPVLTIH